MNVGFKIWDKNGKALTTAHGNFIKIEGSFEHTGTKSKRFYYPSRGRERLFMFRYKRLAYAGSDLLEPTLTVSDDGVKVDYFYRNVSHLTPVIQVFYGYIL